MSLAPFRLEQGDTRLFTTTYSAAPATTPYLAFYIGSGGGVLVNCATASTSDTTHFYRFFTLPATETMMMAEWVASFTAAGPVITRALVQIIKTIPG